MSSLPNLKPLGLWIADLSGIILMLVLPAIRFKPQARMQSETVAASRRCDWNTIKQAARRAREEEMTIGRLGREEGDAALQSVEAFQAVADLLLDSSNKYTPLLRQLRWRPFSRALWRQEERKHETLANVRHQPRRRGTA